MNRYYEDPYDDVKSCGVGLHGYNGFHINGRCIDCGRTNADRIYEISLAIKPVNGKHKGEYNTDEWMDNG